jgi:hypothetical protein
MITDTKATSARAFVRSLNILLKFTRLYRFDHARTATQFQTVWSELRAALTDNEAGLLLASSGSQLLLDGVPLGSSPAERSFAQLLSGAGLASIHFSPNITQEDLSRFVRAFPAAAGSPNTLAQQLREALDGVSGIRLNEICFVPADSAAANLNMAVQLTAQTLGANPQELQGWFNDPQKLLQLIAAAEGSKGGSGDSSASGGGGGGAGAATSTTGTWAAAKAALLGGTKGAGSLGVPGSGTPFGGTELFSPQEEDVRAIMRLLRQLGKASQHPDATSEPIAFQQRLTTLPLGAQFMFRQALASLAAQAPSDRPDQPMLLKLAQHLAIRFALDSYERGEVRVNAVRQMLDRMAREVEGLRGILSAQEKRMAEAGMPVEPFSDVLDRQFWAEVPEATKHDVLSSPKAWCVPPRNVRQYVEQRLRGGENNVAWDILSNYASCVNREEADARRKTAIGLCELADLYSSADGSLLRETIGLVGAQLSVERDAELQSLASAAFVRLSQEAATRRRYTAMQQTLASLESVENQRPAFAQSLRPRISLENRLPEFIEDALRAEHIPDSLANLMRLMPGPATEHLIARFSRCGFREDCAVLIELARELGPDCIPHLRERFHSDPATAAVETIGLLSRLDATTLEQGLPARLGEWQRSLHDRAVRQLAAGGAPDRGRLLLAVFDALDPLIRPLALDEIGMSNDPSAVPHLIRLAEGGAPSAEGAYLRLKAIEALGRLRAPEAVPVLRRIVEAKQLWRWAHPSELRIVAAQVLQKIDPDWMRDFVPRSGLDLAETSLVPLDPDPQSSCVRQRRYPRLRLARPLAAVTTNLRENCRLEIQIMNLNGGLAISERFLIPGTSIALKINPGLRPVCVQAFVRDARARATGFEIADIRLEDRGRLRRMLVELGGPPLAASPEDRSRRRPGPLSKP